MVCNGQDAYYRRTDVACRSSRPAEYSWSVSEGLGRRADRLAGLCRLRLVRPASVDRLAFVVRPRSGADQSRESDRNSAAEPSGCRNHPPDRPGRPPRRPLDHRPRRVARVVSGGVATGVSHQVAGGLPNCPASVGRIAICGRRPAVLAIRGCARRRRNYRGTPLAHAADGNPNRPSRPGTMLLGSGRRTSRAAETIGVDGRSPLATGPRGGQDAGQVRQTLGEPLHRNDRAAAVSASFDAVVPQAHRDFRGGRQAPPGALRW